MNFKFCKILIILLSFLFLNGFTPIFSIIGPGLTVLTSGNIYKASAQFVINQKIEKETGKNSFTLVKTFVEDEINNKSKKNSFEEDLKKLVEKRIKMTRKKLNEQNFEKLVKERIKITRSLLKINNINQ